VCIFFLLYLLLALLDIHFFLAPVFFFPFSYSIFFLVGSVRGRGSGSGEREGDGMTTWSMEMEKKKKQQHFYVLPTLLLAFARICACFNF
jgi:hypothetical protein